MLINCRSVVHKISLLHDFIREQNLGLLLLTETWLDTNIQDSHFDLDNFQIFRADRSIKKGGGVAIIVNSAFPAIRIDSPTPIGTLHDLGLC